MTQSTGDRPPGKGIDRTSWMGRLPDRVPVGDLTIAGTHQSCAHHGLAARCQNPGFDVPAQLRAGIRYLDVRCRVHHGELRLYHEFVSQRAALDSVLAACAEFLEQRPSETVLMRIRQEYSTQPQDRFRRLFAAYLRAGGVEDRVYLDPVVPRLGEVRGKVLVLSGSSYVGGLRWKDEAVMDVQDCWRVERPSVKLRQVLAHAERALDRRSSEHADPRLFVNHLSGHRLPLLTPRTVAARVNPAVALAVRALRERHRANGPRAGLGVLAMDFADEAPGLVRALVGWNFAH
ncbi:phosphatidylinositol-specific phospholipase C [Kitasatospora phosalacinea]|uniref:phosphatidylinositol-specific phospholipase C n=1 Tax=Kitasatospora phosalacinea TaxID=2065 RepID=UPI0036689C69